MRDFEGFFRATRTGVLQEGSNAAAWNSIARLYAQAAVQLEPEDLEEFLDGVVAYRDLLEDFNSSGRMEQIVLEDANRHRWPGGRRSSFPTAWATIGLTP